MSRAPIPFFPAPPPEYEQRYMSQVLRAFSVFAGQTQVPGPQQATQLKLTNTPVFADNAAAGAGGLVPGDVYRTATGELRIVI